MTRVKHFGTKAYEDRILDNQKNINKATLLEYEQMFARNFRANLEDIEKGKNVADLIQRDPTKRPKHTLVIANGPTVAKYNQLKEIAESGAYKNGKLTIIACDASIKKCLDAGVIPTYMTCIDGNPIIADFFKDIRINDHTLGKVVPICAISIDPETRRWINTVFTTPIHWFVPVWDNVRLLDASNPSVTRFCHYITNKMFLETLGNVGGFSGNLCGVFGANPIGLIGMDYGYPADTDIEKDQYFSGYTALSKKTNEVSELGYQEMVKRNPEWDGQPKLTAENYYRLVKNRDTGKSMLSNINWDAYREMYYKSLESMKKALDSHNVPFPRIENLSPESTICHKLMKTRSLTAFLEEANQ